jgi:hypothetical protein
LHPFKLKSPGNIKTGNKQTDLISLGNQFYGKYGDEQPEYTQADHGCPTDEDSQNMNQ